MHARVVGIDGEGQQQRSDRCRGIALGQAGLSDDEVGPRQFRIGRFRAPDDLDGLLGLAQAR